MLPTLRRRWQGWKRTPPTQGFPAGPIYPGAGHGFDTGHDPVGDLRIQNLGMRVDTVRDGANVVMLGAVPLGALQPGFGVGGRAGLK